MAVNIRDNLKNGSLWNEFATILNAAIFDADTQKNNYEELLKGLANVEKSNRWAEKITDFGGLGSFAYKEEGKDAKEDSFEEGYSKTLEHISFSKTVIISRELRDDNRVREAKQKCMNMVAAWKRTKAEYLSQMLTTSIGATTTMAFGGKTGIDITAPDGKALFAADHLMKSVTGGTQCNLFKDELGSDPRILNKISNALRNMKDDRGVAMGYTADTLIVPGNRPELERFAKAIIGSDGEVGSNKNDINAERGKWKLIVNPLWTPASGNPYIVMSSEALKELRGTNFFNRTELDIEDDEEVKNRNLIYNGFGRFSAGFANYRHVCMGGSSDTTAKTL